MKPIHTPYVVTAACKFDNLIVCGHRHYDTIVMQPLLDSLFTQEEETSLFQNGLVTEGFIDQWGNFLTRQEARIIADREHQTERPLSPMSDIIFSEDLYSDHLRIVCAATKFPTGMIICSARHHDAVMNNQVRALHKVGKPPGQAGTAGQGFLTTDGEWVDRFDALAIAEDAYQINCRHPKTSPLDRLFSEDLY